MSRLLIWPEKTAHGTGSRWRDLEGVGEWRPPRSPDIEQLDRLWAELEATELPGVKLADDARLSGAPQTWSTCGYCGSIHPGDLAALISDGGPFIAKWCPVCIAAAEKNHGAWPCHRCHLAGRKLYAGLGAVHPMQGCNVPGVKLGGSDWKYGWPHKFYLDVPNPDSNGRWLSTSSGGGLCEVCRADGDRDRPPDPDCEWCEGKGYNPSHVPKGTEPYAYPTLWGKFYSEHLNDLEDETLLFLAPLLAERTGITFSRVDGKLSYRAPAWGHQA